MFLTQSSEGLRAAPFLAPSSCSLKVRQPEEEAFPQRQSPPASAYLPQPPSDAPGWPHHDQAPCFQPPGRLQPRDGGWGPGAVPEAELAPGMENQSQPCPGNGTGGRRSLRRFGLGRKTANLPGRLSAGFQLGFLSCPPARCHSFALRSVSMR